MQERRNLLKNGGLTIKTTINMADQEAADNAVKAHVFAKDQAIGALAMVEPGTGNVLALAQSRPMGSKRKEGETYLNYVVPEELGDSKCCQAGSTFKAFTLAAALRAGSAADHVVHVDLADDVQLRRLRQLSRASPSSATAPSRSRTRRPTAT